MLNFAPWLNGPIDSTLLDNCICLDSWWKQILTQTILQSKQKPYAAPLIQSGIGNVWKKWRWCCTQWHKINKFIYHSICRMFYMSVWLFLLHHQHRYGRFRTGFAQPNAITVKINGKSLIVERKLIYIHKYEICHQHAYWHIAVYSAPLSHVAIVC